MIPVSLKKEEKTLSTMCGWGFKQLLKLTHDDPKFVEILAERFG
uniref:Uncharacterized protein n=1 Tax=Arundo donax TaxID=35708 RepID=A0A0A9G151_ARUDO